jgi:signal transduction histidine kinase
MADVNPVKAELSALAAYLAGHREQILRAWQSAVELDPQLTTPSSISRAQFNDHIPQVLDAFERRLQAEDAADKAQAHLDERQGAAEHGLHRWQQGYNQRETVREWGHLHYALLNALEDYGREHPELQGSVMPVARRALVRLCGEGVAESAARYERLQRTEAASRVRELESALEQLQSLDRQRAETWREAAHDLRGTVGVISNASAILTREAAVDPSRVNISQILQRSVTSLRGLLTDLMDLARLEAGQETRRVQPFDAAELLREFADNVRPLASERNLFLKAEGPASLPVEGDSVKILRVAQNLVLNALKVTQRGGIRVLWDERADSSGQQWELCVQDTGPGFQPQSPSAPLERALREATAESHELDARAANDGGASPDTEPAATLKSQSSARTPAIPAGEGIGLSIVKRLCELLDASLELETAPGKGTTFRVLLPRAYPDPAPPESPPLA